MDAMDAMPAEVLDRPVRGSGLVGGAGDGDEDGDEPATLRGQLAGDRPTLLVFLRHFGCLFCREMVKDVRVAAESADGNGGGRRHYPHVVFAHMADAAEGARFMARYWPAAPAVSDPDRRLYRAAGLGRGGASQMFRPAVWSAGLAAWRKGHRVGLPVGDPWQMSGLVLLAPAPAGDAAVLWRHPFEHAGDRVDFASLSRFVEPAPA